MIAIVDLMGCLVDKNGETKLICTPMPGLGGLSRFP